MNFAPFYQTYLDDLAAFDLAFATISSDQMTIAPKKGLPYSNKMLSILGTKSFEIANDPQTIAKIEEYAKTLDPNSLESREVNLRLEEIARTKNIPADVYQAYLRSRADAQMIWEQAKNEDNYELFKPYLKDLMEKTVDLLQYDPAFTSDNAYDLLLDQYEKGMNQKKYDAFFDAVKSDLVPFIARLHQEGKEIDDSVLNTPIDVKAQAEFAQDLMRFLHADPTRVYLSETEHPFTNFLSHNDVRITTHYYPERFLSAILSTIHEYGHALYALQIDEEYDGTMLKNAIGSAAHESQSRFLENHIGRSRDFWNAFYPVLVDKFPQFGKYTPEELYEIINTTHNGLVRTEADELTYPLHILIRYEIEKEMAKGTMDYDKLPEIWNDKYEEYLGIRPDNMKDGVLQDVHWATGYLGYFPTYALGSAMAAQIYEAMAQEVDVKAALDSGHFEEITNWLQEHVHRFGAGKSMMEITEEVSGKPFDPHIYTRYLIGKYSDLYGLK